MRRATGQIRNPQGLQRRLHPGADHRFGQTLIERTEGYILGHGCSKDLVIRILQHQGDAAAPMVKSATGVISGLIAQQNHMNIIANNLANTSSSVKAYNVDMAAAIIAGLPTMVIYVLAGKFFVRGLTAGAVKG